MPIHACAFRPSHKWRKCAPLICAICFHAKENKQQAGLHLRILCLEKSEREGRGGAFFNHPRGILQPGASDVAVGTRQSPYACESGSCVNSPFIGCVDCAVDYDGNAVA